MTHEKIAGVFDAWVDDGRDGGLEEGHSDVVEQVLDSIDFRAGETVLDLGCGTGWATRRIAKSAPGVQCIGVDCSPKMIAKADSLHSFTIRARYDYGTFEALDFPDGHFDRAFSMEALYYAVDLERALAELHRVLKPGAIADVVINFYEERADSASWPGDLGVAMQRMSESGWRAAFERAGFADVSTSRVVDRRGPGDEASFQPSAACPDWSAQVAAHGAGSLRITAVKPA